MSLVFFKEIVFRKLSSILKALPGIRNPAGMLLKAGPGFRRRRDIKPCHIFIQTYWDPL